MSHFIIIQILLLRADLPKSQPKYIYKISQIR